MTEPQLSAELEKRFNEALKGIVYVRKYKSTYKYSQDDDGIEIDLTEEVNGLKHFLATALEEEREKVLSEVEEGLSMLTRYLRSIYRLDHSDGEPPQQMLLEDDVMSVLNQLKGE